MPEYLVKLVIGCLLRTEVIETSRYSTVFNQPPSNAQVRWPQRSRSGSGSGQKAIMKFSVESVPISSLAQGRPSRRGIPHSKSHEIAEENPGSRRPIGNGAELVRAGPQIDARSRWRFGPIEAPPIGRVAHPWANVKVTRKTRLRHDHDGLSPNHSVCNPLPGKGSPRSKKSNPPCGGQVGETLWKRREGRSQGSIKDRTTAVRRTEWRKPARR